MQTLKKFYFGKSKFKPFVSTWKTDNLSSGSSTATQVKLPLVSTGNYNFVVEWGDGTQSTITAWNVGNTHAYSVAGTYQITIKGTCDGWQFNSTGDRLKLLSVQTWGNLRLGDTGRYFGGCSNLDLTGVTDILNLTGTLSLYYAFGGCTALTTVGRMNEWDTSNVTSMRLVFQQATNFNQNIGAWNVSNVTNMQLMFSQATNFNQNIGTWNVGKVTDMQGTFSQAINFNQNIGAWNTSSVTTMSGMFQQAINFNQNISTWNTSNVTNMQTMFNTSGAVTSLFNQNIGAWNVSKVTNFASMFAGSGGAVLSYNNGGSSDINNWTLATTGSISFASMFSGASIFNQPIGNWNTSRVTNMSSMFGAIGAVAAFNQNIGSWNVSSVTNMYQMFLNARFFNNGGDSSINSWNTLSVTNMSEMFRSTGSASPGFNQPIGNWNVSNVTNMSGMFQYQSSFNQDIGLWNVSKVSAMNLMFDQALAFNNGESSSINNWNPVLCTNMSQMFSTAPAFNQPIGSWNVSNITNFTNFMASKSPATFSTANLDAIYNGWSSRPVKKPITITFGTAKYTAAGVAGRAILTGAPNNWVITDGGI